MQFVLFNPDNKTLVIVEAEYGKGIAVEDSFGGFDYEPVRFSYTPSAKRYNEDDPRHDMNEGLITLVAEDGTVLTDYEEADYGAIFDELGTEQAEYYQNLFNSDNAEKFFDLSGEFKEVREDEHLEHLGFLFPEKIKELGTFPVASELGAEIYWENFVDEDTGEDFPIEGVMYNICSWIYESREDEAEDVEHYMEHIGLYAKAHGDSTLETLVQYTPNTEDATWRRVEKYFDLLQERKKEGLPYITYEDFEKTLPVFAEYTLPASWASYLVNSDSSGLEEDEIKEVDEFVNNEMKNNSFESFNCTGTSDEPYFKRSSDANNLGGDMLDYTFLVSSGKKIEEVLKNDKDEDEILPITLLVEGKEVEFHFHQNGFYGASIKKDDGSHSTYTYFHKNHRGVDDKQFNENTLMEMNTRKPEGYLTDFFVDAKAKEIIDGNEVRLIRYKNKTARDGKEVEQQTDKVIKK